MSAIFKWMFVLLLLITVAGGGGAYWFYLRSDEILRTEIMKHLANLSPDVRFGIERANFDFSGRVRLLGLSMHLPGDVQPAFYVPETIVTLDNQKLTDFENVSIQKLRLLDPQCRAVRRRDGRWNWQGITWHSDPSKPVPEIHIEHGTVTIELERDQHAVRKLKLADLNVTSIPAAARKVTAVISTRIEPAGPLTATIDANLDGPPFKLEAKWLRLPVDDDLIELVSDLSPAVSDKLRDIRSGMAKLAATQNAATPIPNLGNGNPSSISLQSEYRTGSQPRQTPFGVKCNCDLHCKLELAEPNSPLKYQVLTDVRSGQLSNALLPFPLYEIRGAIYAAPGQIIIRDVKAENGTTRIFLNTQVAPGQPPQTKLQIRGCQIDEPLKARLPESIRKIINSLALTGLCDLDLSQNKETSAWEADLNLKSGYVEHEKFPYPVRDVNGTVRVRGNRIEIDGQGRASGVPVTLTGWILNAGPANESEINIKADGVPINSVLLKASTDSIRKAMTELNLQGTQDVRVRFSKAAGVGQKYRMNSVVKLQDCSCMLKTFPYRIHHLDGLVIGDDDSINFKELTGEHDETKLRATGQYRRTNPGRLDLMIRAENAAFDRSLEAALSPALRRQWQEFQPSGRFDVDTLITWVPGQPCQVVLPRIKITDAEIAMQSFPWPLRSISGEFAYEASRLTMKSLSAQHDDTQIRGRGIATFVAGEPWRVRFDELHIDDLIPNSTFRKALPSQLQRTFEALNPSGKFSIGTPRQGTVELAGGENGGPIASAWDVQIFLTGCSVSAGLPVDDIYGRVDLKGNNDGRTTNLTGQLDLDSISVFRHKSGLAHQISRVVGPFRLQNNQFVAGSLAMAMPSGKQPPPVALSERISGDFIDGKMTLDAVTDLREESDYRLQITLSRGRLEAYAQQYLRGQSNLAGIMNGWLYLWGKGRGEDQIKGRGELQIAPAALYELPVFVKIFQTLGLNTVDRTAFDQADIQYHIDNSRFTFDAIDLVGKNSISLRGRGYIQFDGSMILNFYSMLARNQIRIPILHEIAGALSRGWVGVKVTGHIGAPETRIVAVPEFDEAMKQFLGTFEQPPSRNLRIFPSSNQQR